MKKVLFGILIINFLIANNTIEQNIKLINSGVIAKVSLIGGGRYKAIVDDTTPLLFDVESMHTMKGKTIFIKGTENCQIQSIGDVSLNFETIEPKKAKLVCTTIDSETINIGINTIVNDSNGRPNIQCDEVIYPKTITYIPICVKVPNKKEKFEIFIDNIDVIK